MSYKRIIISEYGNPEVLKMIEEKDLPEPKEGEARIKVLAVSAAFTDVLIRRGLYPDVKIKPPFSPGYDMAGVIDKLGKDSYKFKVGQKVSGLTITGSYSEYICVSEDSLVPIPEEVDPAEAVSMVLSYVTAYQMLYRTVKAKEGQSILVHGAGGAVGMALVQLGRLLNLEIFGTASKSKQDFVRSLGAIPIDYENEDFTDVIMKKTKKGVDAVFDPLGGKSLARSFKLLKPGGTLAAYGFYNSAMRGEKSSIAMDFLKLKLWNALPNKKRSEFYSIGFLLKKHPEWFKEDLSNLFILLKEGKVKPFIEERLPLSDAVKAHKLIEQRKIKGKIVLIPGL